MDTITRVRRNRSRLFLFLVQSFHKYFLLFQ